MKKISAGLKHLFLEWSGEPVTSYTPLPDSGSYRKYFRINSENQAAIGAYNHDVKENLAFMSFTKHFRSIGLNVPELYAHNMKAGIYLIQDLGDKTLFSLAEENNTEQLFISNVLNLYKLALKHLIKFQLEGGANLDYSLCYPSKHFDRQSMLWDLNYFKYYFLKLFKIQFDEQHLENDFNRLTEYLLSADTNYFLYRDFQARNILLYDNDLYFVDYQGGREGALQYDVASLLMQAKLNLSSYVRSELLGYYIEKLNKNIKITRQEFFQFYYGYSMIRILQTMGAYGFRGKYEKKIHFIKSIPFALKNIEWLLDTDPFLGKLDELSLILKKIIDNKELIESSTTGLQDKLTVTINSFSYKNGIPDDYAGNGGGFVFDCRSLNNPGRFESFKNLTGKDIKVITFLERREDAKKFLQDVYSIVDRAVENYSSRDFTNLMVNFGCTGGRHRSVYCAENLRSHLEKNFDVTIKLNHTALREMEKF